MTYLRSEGSAHNEVLLKKGFKCFMSNRFVRLGELSELFIKHKDMIKALFEKQVSINSKKLVLAIHSNYKSHWISVCCKITSFFNHTFTLPIKEILGINEFMKTKVADRS